MTVVVSPTCPGYEAALALCTLAQELRPWCRIRLVDVAAPGSDPVLGDRTEPILGTPTYLLYGRTVFLGNPSLEALLDLMDDEGDGDGNAVA